MSDESSIAARWFIYCAAGFVNLAVLLMNDVLHVPGLLAVDRL